MAITGTDARQAVDAGAPYEVHQQRLDSIILMMRHTNLDSSDVLS